MLTAIVFIVGLLLGFGAASYGGMRLLEVSARHTIDAQKKCVEWGRELVRERAHVTHLKRMLTHARSRRAAVRILGLGPSATEDDVRAMFRALVRRAHPDRGGDSDVFQMVVRAKDAALREVS